MIGADPIETHATFIRTFNNRVFRLTTLLRAHLFPYMLLINLISIQLAGLEGPMMRALIDIALMATD